MKKYIGISILALGLGFTSCDDFLDELPDNRAAVDTEEKVEKLLVSAYPDIDYILVTETMSDNMDDMGESNPNTARFLDQVFHWDDVTESNNESPEQIWTSSYEAIVNANQALDAIGQVGDSRNMKIARAEGLMARAYNHFILVNVFCKHYNSKTSTTDLGIPYLDGLEEQLNLHHERGTVAEVYEKIDKDLQEALPLVGDDYMTVPKFHFNAKAAYAFAARFYLYYEKWDKAIEYANLCLGSNPVGMLRDWSYVSTLTNSFDAYTNQYIDASLNCNLLLMTAYSNLGVFFGPYTTWKRYAHNNWIASYETSKAINFWVDKVTANSYKDLTDRGRYIASHYYSSPKTYGGNNYDFVIFFKLPYLFEYTDPVAQIGYRRTIYPALTTDEVLLNRAEAYILKKQYDQATADINTWVHNITKVKSNFTTDSIVKFYNAEPYSYDDEAKLQSTVKKHLHPDFEIDAEGSVQEAMLQCVLGLRRIETLQQGLRWFDIKRYGIEIPRRVINADGKPESAYDWLTVNDERRAVQIPDKVIDAGITPNPRAKTQSNDYVGPQLQEIK